jgi:tetratricopeptide (TPR) repeat protein
MDCESVARGEIVENYLLGRLSEEDREAFEEHYFECARCFDELRALQAVQAELRRPDTKFESRTARPFLRWAPAALAAAAVLVVAVVVSMRSTSPTGSSETANTQPRSQGQTPETSQPQPPEPTVAPEPSLEQLARVEPPRYEPPTLRNVPDEATARFLRAMERYGAADYARAVEGLRSAAKLDPDAPHIRFFLGVSHLMLGEDGAAIDRLRATIALGDSPYLEEAHWYLAKAYLRRKDLGAAESELKTLIQLRGRGSDEASRLLTQLERLEKR